MGPHPAVCSAVLASILSATALSLDGSTAVVGGGGGRASSLLLRRILSGDGNSTTAEYAELNMFLDGVAFSLPDVDVSRDLPGALGVLNITLAELTCTDAGVDEISIGHQQRSARRIDVILGAGLDLTCSFDYEFWFDAGFLGVINDGGQGTLFTIDNRMNLSLAFESEDFDVDPPTKVTISEGCSDSNPIFNVDRMDFSGSVSAVIIDFAQSLITDLVEGEIKTFICDELDTVEPMLKALLEDADELMAPYRDDNAVGDPLGAEKALMEDVKGEEGVELFDFTQTDGLVHEGLQFIIDQVNSILGGGIINDGKSNIFGKNMPQTRGNTLGINALLQSYVLDDKGELIIPLNQVLFSDQNTVLDATISIESVRVVGMDSISRIEPLTVIGAHTLQSQVTWDMLDVEAVLSIEARPSSDPEAIVYETDADASLREEITIKAGFRDLDATLSFLLALDESIFGSMQFGSLLRIDRILPCLLSSIRAAEIAQLHISAGAIIPPTLEGFLSDGLSQLISQVSDAALAMYEAALVDAMPGMFDILVVPLVNDLINDFMDDPSDVACSPLEDTTDGTTVDLRDLLLAEEDASKAGGHGTSPYGDLFSTLKALIDDALLSSDAAGSPKINDVLLWPLTESQSGTRGELSFPGDLFRQEVELNIVDYKGYIELGMSDVTVQNIDSMGHPLVLLDPVDAHVVDNIATVGSGGRALRIEAGLLLALGGEKQSLRNELRVGVEMSSATIDAAVLAKIEERSLSEFPMRDTLNPWCWLSTIPAPNLTVYGTAADGEGGATLSLRELDATIGELRLDVECVACTSPGLLSFADALSTEEAVQDATDVANRGLAYLSGIFGGEFLQVQIDRMLHEAASKCPHHPSYGEPVPEYKSFEVEKYSDDSTVEFLITMAIVVTAMLVAAVLITMTVRWIVRRRHRRWIKTLTEEEIHRLYREQVYETEEANAIDKATSSMIFSKAIPRWIRWFMPIVIIGNIALFLSGHISLGATVNIVFQFADEQLTLDGFFDFTMAQTTFELWKAGAKVLAILILIFSIIWPYTKQLMTMAMWCLPPSVLSAKRRGKILLWLDILAKWSMIDIFVLIVALIAFRVSVTSPENLAFLPDNLYSVDLLVVPLWGLYANMTAQLVSQVSSHVIIHYHRKIVAEALDSIKRGELSVTTDTDQSIESFSVDSESTSQQGVTETPSIHEEDEGPKAPLRKYLFGRGDHKEGQNLSIARGVDYALVVAALTVVGLVVAGCSISSFQFEILGAVGLLMEAGQEFEPAVSHYSVFSIVGLLFDQARFIGTAAQYVGLGTLSIILILTCLVMPLFLVGLLLWLWFAGTTRSSMSRILIWIEIVKAWQYVEVYIISVVIATWQVGGLSAMMVNEYCGALDSIFSTLVYYGVIEKEDAQCFYASSKVEAGTFVLMAAAVLLALLSHFVTKAAAQKLHEEEKNARNERLSKAETFMSFSGVTSGSSDSLNLLTASPEKIAPVPVQFVDNYRWLLVYGR